MCETHIQCLCILTKIEEHVNSTFKHRKLYCLHLFTLNDQNIIHDEVAMRKEGG